MEAKANENLDIALCTGFHDAFSKTPLGSSARMLSLQFDTEVTDKSESICFYFQFLSLFGTVQSRADYNNYSCEIHLFYLKKDESLSIGDEKKIGD